MRLWHQVLIPYIDNKRLYAQHRECCALRGKGWGRKHATVDYVFKYDLSHLFQYHVLVMNEIARRNKCENLDLTWLNRLYRGKNLPESSLDEVGTYIHGLLMSESGKFFEPMIYAEHDDRYLKECLLNLKAKGAELVNGKTIDGLLIELDLKGVK